MTIQKIPHWRSALPPEFQESPTPRQEALQVHLPPYSGGNRHFHPLYNCDADSVLLPLYTLRCHRRCSGIRNIRLRHWSGWSYGRSAADLPGDLRLPLPYAPYGSTYLYNLRINLHCPWPAPGTLVRSVPSAVGPQIPVYSYLLDSFQLHHHFSMT